MPEGTSEKDEDLEVVPCLAWPGCLGSPCEGWGGRQGWRKVEADGGRALNTGLDSISQTSAFQTVLLRALGVPGGASEMGA